ncbi:MAG: SDR family oxidoreductase [Rhodospirillaceae bacterium]
MDLGLKGKNAAITGSSQGIGEAIVMALAEEGCNVAINGRDEGRINKVVAAAEAKGVKAVGIIADMSSEAGCQEFVEKTAAGLGGINILVNNVGGMIPGALDNMGEDVWSTAINLNLMACVYTTKHAIAHLKKNDHGRVLNVSGISGTQLLPGSYTTTIPNTGIIGFTKLIANELAPSNITVNNICPGMTATESWVPRAEAMAKVRDTTSDNLREMFSAQTMLGRWADPSEIGDVAAFLVSDKNSYMTGTTVEVCGGITKYIG